MEVLGVEAASLIAVSIHDNIKKSVAGTTRAGSKQSILTTQEQKVKD